MPGIATNDDNKGVRSLNLAVACGIAVFNAYLSCRDKDRCTVSFLSHLIYLR